MEMSEFWKKVSKEWVSSGLRLDKGGQSNTGFDVGESEDLFDAMNQDSDDDLSDL